MHYIPTFNKITRQLPVTGLHVLVHLLDLC